MKLYYPKMNALFILFVLSVISFSSSGQFHDRRSAELKANSRWFFGDWGINFNQEPPELLETSKFLGVYAPHEEGMHYATEFFGQRFYNAIPGCDPQSGALRLLATRNNIYDANLDAMPHGEFSTDFYETVSFQKNIAVVPVINDPDKYYFFNTSLYLGFTCSVIDMNLNDGKGDVDTSYKNVVLKSPEFQEAKLDIAGVIPGNNCDYWIILTETADGRSDANIHSFNIAANGTILHTSTFSLPKEDVYEARWDYQASPNRDLIAFISHRDYKNSNVSDPDTRIHFLSFNLDNGVVSLSALPDIELGAAYGGLDAHGSFTPDNRYYLASKPEYNGTQVILYKYDLSASATDYNAVTFPYTIPYWLLNKKVRETYIPPILYFKPYNNKIFFNIPYSYREPSKFEPGMFNIFHNSLIKLCNMEPAAADGFWTSVAFGPELPFSRSCRIFTGNEIVYPYLPVDTVPHIAVDSVFCFDPTLPFPTLTLTAKPGFDSYVWNDGSTGSSTTIKQPGKYWVYYKGSCNTKVDTFIYRYRAPEHILQPDTVPCEERFPIEITADAATWYQWDDNSTQQKRTIYHPGTYSIQFERWGCRQFDTITVGSKHCPCNISVPNAFTPNGDGLNDFFKPSIALGCVPSEYSFRILNRWGQIVYGSFNEFDQGWDGTYKGGTADAGTYIYELRFKSRFLEAPYYKKGELILVR